MSTAAADLDKRDGDIESYLENFCRFVSYNLLNDKDIYNTRHWNENGRTIRLMMMKNWSAGWQRFFCSGGKSQRTRAIGEGETWRKRWINALCGYPIAKMEIKETKILKSKNSFYAHFWTKTGDFFLKRWKTTNILPQIFFQVKNVKKMAF